MYEGDIFERVGVGATQGIVEEEVVLALQRLLANHGHWMQSMRPV